MKILKDKKIWLILIFLFIFIVFLIGLISLMFKSGNTETKNKDEFNIYKKELDKYPQFKELLTLLQGGDIELQKEAINLLKAEIIHTGKTKIELEAQLMKQVDNYIRNIKIDNLKQERDYVEEFKREIEKLKYVNLDFNDKNNLKISGIYMLNVVDGLSKIGVPKNYYEFHKSEVILLGMLGHALIKLSNTEDPEKATALLLIINNLANLQERILEKL